MCCEILRARLSARMSLTFQRAVSAKTIYFSRHRAFKSDRSGRKGLQADPSSNRLFPWSEGIAFFSNRRIRVLSNDTNFEVCDKRGEGEGLVLTEEPVSAGFATFLPRSIKCTLIRSRPRDAISKGSPGGTSFEDFSTNKE